MHAQTSESVFQLIFYLNFYHFFPKNFADPVAAILTMAFVHWATLIIDFNLLPLILYLSSKMSISFF